MKERTKQWITPDLIRHNLIMLRNLCFEVTDACNLSCDYCVYRDLFIDHDERVGKNMSFDIAKTIIDYLVNLWNTTSLIHSRTISFYGGEPLLNMDLIKRIVTYIENLHANCSFSFRMTTNAMLLDKHIDYLKDKNFKLLISLDGNYHHDGHRKTYSGENSFTRVFDNVTKLKECYPDYFREMVSFNSVLTELSDVESVFNFFQSTFDKTPSISEINARGLDMTKLHTYSAMYNNMTESINRASKPEDLSERLFMSNPMTKVLYDFIKAEGDYYDDYVDLLSTHRSCKIPCSGTCSPFGKKLFVTVHGKILPCERIGQEHFCGSVSNNHVSLDLKNIAKTYNVYLNTLSKQCSNCSINNICNICLFYLPRTAEGTIFCNRNMSQEKADALRLACINYMSEHSGLYDKLIQNVTRI